MFEVELAKHTVASRTSIYSIPARFSNILNKNCIQASSDQYGNLFNQLKKTSINFIHIAKYKHNIIS